VPIRLASCAFAVRVGARPLGLLRQGRKPAAAVYEQRGYDSSLNHRPTVKVLGRRRARWVAVRCSLSNLLVRIAHLSCRCAPPVSAGRAIVWATFSLSPPTPHPELVPIRPASVLVPAVQPERCAAHRCVSARPARRRGGRLVEPTIMLRASFLQP